MPSLPPLLLPLSSLRRSCDVGELGEPLDHGFHNPMFDKPNRLPDIPGVHRIKTNNSSSLTQAGVYFVNPPYDENETDFNGISGLQ